MVRYVPTGPLIVSLSILVSPAIADDKKEAQVKEVCTKFLKAVSDQDAEGVMKFISLPWFEGGKAYMDVPELKAHIQKRLEKKPEKIPTEVVKVQGWADFRKEYLKDKEDEAKAKFVEETLGKDGYVAYVEIDGKARPALVVSITEGKATIAGIIDSGAEKK